MDEEEGKFDLEERTFQFALGVRQCLSVHRWKRAQWPDVNQLLRSSGSVAANYVEANNATSKPDFIYRIGVSKKECSESRLRLLGATTSESSPLESLHSSTAKLMNSSAFSLPSSKTQSDPFPPHSPLTSVYSLVLSH